MLVREEPYRDGRIVNRERARRCLVVLESDAATEGARSSAAYIAAFICCCGGGAALRGELAAASAGAGRGARRFAGTTPAVTVGGGRRRALPDTRCILGLGVAARNSKGGGWLGMPPAAALVSVAPEEAYGVSQL